MDIAPQLDGGELHIQSSFLGQSEAAPQPFVVGRQSQESADQGTVGSVARSGPGERPVQFDQGVLELSRHQAAGEQAHATGPRRV